MNEKMLLENWKCSRQKAITEKNISVEPTYGKRLNIGKPTTALKALIQAGEVSNSIYEDCEAECCAWVADLDWIFHCSFPHPARGELFLHF